MLEIDVWKKKDFAERLTWDEWKERWAMVSNLTDAHNLVHDIYSVVSWRQFRADESPSLSVDDENERFCFLLELADSADTTRPNNAFDRVNPEHALRTKALNVLKAHFFSKAGEHYSWERWLKYFSPEAFRKLLWFLRLDRPDERLDYHYLVNSDAQVQKFAWEFCNFLWNLSPYRDFEKFNKETVRLIFESHGEALRISFGLHRLLELVPGSFQLHGSAMVRAWDRFDEKAIAVLRSLKSHHKDLDEAYLEGYQPVVAIRMVESAQASIKRYLNRDSERFTRKLVMEERKKELNALNALLAA